MMLLCGYRCKADAMLKMKSATLSDNQGHLVGMDQIDLNGLDEASLNAEETYSARVRSDTHAVQLLGRLG